MADFLEQAFPDPVEPEAEASPAPEVEAQPAPEPAQASPVQEAPHEREDNRIPLGTFLDMRDKMREAQRERDELKARNSQSQEVPDPYDDPQAFSQYQSQQLDAAMQQQKLAMSWEDATEKHGLEPVNAAKDWALQKAQQDPIFNSELDTAMRTKVRPIEWIVQQHKRDALLADIGGNVDDWFTREAAKRGYAAQPAPTPAVAIPAVAASVPKPAPPPRSIASDVTPATPPALDDNASFGAIFARK